MHDLAKSPEQEKAQELANLLRSAEGTIGAQELKQLIGEQRIVKGETITIAVYTLHETTSYSTDRKTGLRNVIHDTNTIEHNYAELTLDNGGAIFAVAIPIKSLFSGLAMLTGVQMNGREEWIYSYDGQSTVKVIHITNDSQKGRTEQEVTIAEDDKQLALNDLRTQLKQALPWSPEQGVGEGSIKIVEYVA